MTGRYRHYQNVWRIQTLSKWLDDTEAIKMAGGYRHLKNGWRI
jgi:hypothetical protein